MAPPSAEIAAEVAGATKVPVLVEGCLRSIVIRDGIHLARVEFDLGFGDVALEVVLNLLRDGAGRRITADD